MIFDRKWIAGIMTILGSAAPAAAIDERISVDVKELKKAEVAAIEYFAATSDGQYHLQVSKSVNGLPSSDFTVDCAFNADRVYLHTVREAAPENGLPIRYDRTCILTPDEVYSFLDYNEWSGVQVKPRSCCVDREQLASEGVFFPRYIGTALDGAIVVMQENSPRGLFGEAELISKSASLVTINGEQILEGLYSRPGFPDIELRFSTAKPARLLRSQSIAETQANTHTKTVEINYKTWPCGTVFPETIRYVKKLNDTIVDEEIAKITEFERMPESSIGDRFELKGLQLEDGRPVLFYDAHCKENRRCRWKNGELIDFTESDWKELATAGQESAKLRMGKATVTSMDATPRQAQEKSRTSFVFVLFIVAAGLIGISIRLGKSISRRPGV